MATNNKYYKSLQEKGYTPEQIDSMVNAVSSWQDATQVVKNMNQYRGQPQGQNGAITQWPWNANLNYYQYWDDSNPAQQGQRWGMNQKYTGEGTSNTYIDYNPDLKTGDLDPNYLYGQAAKDRNRQEAWYIARRNDNIASALYNEGKVSKEDVEAFLSSQNEWMNSTEADRLNTVESVWKRLWQIQPKEGEKPQEQWPAPEFWATQTDQGGQIYGRASWNDDTSIKTNYDPYSPEAQDLRARQSRYQSLQSMDSRDIALSMAAGVSLYWETAMRDLATYDPQKYQEVQSELKKIQQGDTMNAIASGETDSITKQTTKASDTINDWINKRVESNSTERTYEQLNDMITGKLENSQTAQTATQEMLSLNEQMAELEEKMANLPKEAQKAFKGDVPQYIVDAFVANNAQRYQSELNKLQSRYNAAIELYKTEVAQKQWEAEMDLNERKFSFTKAQQNWENNFKSRQQAWDEYYQGSQLKLNNIKTDASGNPYIINSDGTYEYLTDVTYQRAVEQQVQSWLEALEATWQDWMDGWQCESFTDSWNDTVYGQTMLPVDKDGNIISWRNRTYASEKAQYVNTAIPKAWVTAIFKYPVTAHVSNAAKTYGHTMLVTAYDPQTQMITLKGSNKTGDEKVYTTTMSLNDFRTKYYGAGFWDPSRPTWFQKEQQGAVETWATTIAMNDLYWSLITNAGTQWAKDVLSTAQTMYNTMADLRDDGSLEELISSSDFQKVLKKRAENDYKTDDGWSEFSKLLREFSYNKSLSTKAKKALNRLYLLVEMKLRNESWAAISSSEWMNNFKNMIPGTFQDKQQMRDILQNWDIVIRRYSVSGWMNRNDYQPIFNNERWNRDIFAG